MDIDRYADIFMSYVASFGPRLLAGLIVFFIGLKVIKFACAASAKIIERNDLDPSLASFLKSLIGILLKILLVITVGGMLGVETTSFVALLGAAGLSIGMALSGTLQNFAGGVMILIFKPFKVGHFIETGGYMGTVKEIQIFNTILNTPDNKRVILPNGDIANGSLINYSAETERRVDMIFGISYDDDIDQAKGVLRSIVDSNEKIKEYPEPLIVVHALADSSVNFAVRVWVESPDYWNVFFYMQEAVKKEFDKADITIPYPQRDVHLHNAAQV